MQINLRGCLLPTPAAPKRVLLQDTRFICAVCCRVCRARSRAVPGGELPGDTLVGERGSARRPSLRTLLSPK